MYIYDLPYEINKELCRLLDNDDDWKELAGVHMKYSAFEVNEIEQTARRQSLSPTSQLFTCWGQLNHSVEELFVLLYRMKNVPALRALSPVVNERFHKLLRRLYSSNKNVSREKVQKTVGSESSLPLPVLLIEKGLQMPNSSRGFNGDSQSNDSSTKDSSSTQDVNANDSQYELMKTVAAIPMLSYEDLKEATNNWSESNLLGRGGFGQVFKGEWKLLPVAIKRLLRDDDGKNMELVREMCLNQYRHDNILPLYGYSIGGPEACLVYQLMAGGSLEQRLRLKTHHPPLSWPQRYRIAHGVARGLQYLHTMLGSPLIHGDIKPANILLDQCTMPRIGDFGLARKGPYGNDKTHMKVSRVHGTRAYLPEEYIHSRCLSPAVDVYSYGVVLIEMATALPAMELRKESLLTSSSDRGDLALFEDRILRGTLNSNPHLCREFISIGWLCTKPHRQDRPTMLDVYKRLDVLQFPGKQLQ